MIADGFGNAIRVRLGRVDATEPAPAGRIPADGAPLEEVQVRRGGAFGDGWCFVRQGTYKWLQGWGWLWAA